mgnify:CR=1 FL=1
MELGVLTLLPPVIILAVALYTRNTTSSLLIGAAVCCILQYGTGFLGGFIDLMYGVAGSGMVCHFCAAVRMPAWHMVAHGRDESAGRDTVQICHKQEADPRADVDNRRTGVH